MLFSGCNFISNNTLLMSLSDGRFEFFDVLYDSLRQLFDGQARSLVLYIDVHYPVSASDEKNWRFRV